MHIELGLWCCTQVVQIQIRIDEMEGSYSRDTTSRPLMEDVGIDS
jgi:hypothetical protein